MTDHGPHGEVQRRWFDRLQQQAANGRTGIGSGNGGDDGMSDDWKTAVDNQLKTLHDDFRRVIGWLIACVAAPLVAMLGLYAYTGAKSDALETKISAIQVEQARSAGNMTAMEARITARLESTRPR